MAQLPITCPMANCAQTFNVNAHMADHVLAAHSRGNAPTNNKIPCPTIAINTSPSVWADFTARFGRYCSCLDYTTDLVKEHELVICIPGDCYSTLAWQYTDGALYSLPFADALAAAKEAVVSPQPRSMIHSQLHKCTQ